MDFGMALMTGQERAPILWPKIEWPLALTPREMTINSHLPNAFGG